MRLLLPIGIAILGLVSLSARADDDRKKAELKWARSVADDLFEVVIADDYKNAAALLTGEYAKLLQGQEKPTALPGILRGMWLNVGGATAIKKVTVTSEQIAPDKDEARFKGQVERQDSTQEFVVRVVKEKESGRWRVGFMQVDKPKYLKK